MNQTLEELEAENLNQRKAINEMQQYKASNRAEKMIIQMGKDLIKGTKDVKKEIVQVEKELDKVRIQILKMVDFESKILSIMLNIQIPAKFRKILKRKDEDESYKLRQFSRKNMRQIDTFRREMHAMHKRKYC